MELRREHHYLALGMSAGAAVGLLFGTMLDDVILGVSMGAALGLLIGAMARYR